MPPTASMSSLLLFIVIRLLTPAQSISFNYSSFFPSTPNITYQGDAFPAGGVIELTRNQAEGKLEGSDGRVLYSYPVHLWDAATGNLTNFTTHFSFIVQPVQDKNPDGDGLAFFLAPNGSNIPAFSGGGNLALFNASNSSSLSGYVPTVAVEFDTYANFWDPNAVHVGIDVGDIRSAVYANWTTFDRWVNASVNATIAYDAGATNLSVFFSDTNGTERALSYVVDLREMLPEWVSVGFSASTGLSVELHKILSWSFQSSLQVSGGSNSTSTSNRNTTTNGGGGHGSAAPPTQLPDQKKKIKIGLLVGVLGGVGSLAAGSGLVWLIVCRQRRTSRWRGGAQEGGIDEGIFDDSEFDGGRAPKRFTYQELDRATKNFATEGKLGRGGFGDVYRGMLSDPRMEVAIKKVAKDSRQGKKEYVSEVKIISRLRHRNLVQLVGWCHERGELLLVYEYMPNGSLDAHLFGDGGKAGPLSWRTRYSIAQGVAAALLYLHEEWEQCVVHRDVKSSNVMLDAGFNAKLGDFGLARLVDHGRGLQTTVLAGTMGYLAPECATTGKASKESDVYSFGVVALEIACGRRPIEPLAKEGQVGLVGWVWDLYGKHAVLEAADPKLSSGEFDERRMERLMVVGLWCAHPDFRWRPSMRQVVSALSFETPPPNLPAEMPVPTYATPTGMDLANTGQSPATSTATTASSFSSGYTGTTGASTASTSSGGSAHATSPLSLSTAS